LVVAWAGVGGAVAFLAVRLVHDVGSKPYSEDEAVAGLISMRPIGELLRTVVWDRGGSPLHFLLVHFVFAFSATPAALRWLSVVCALGTVVCTYLLGTELAGKAVGVASAWVVACSNLLWIYGTIGRMYALLAFAGSLNLLLFLRALRQPTKRRVWLAAGSAWLVAATHPFGLITVAAEVVVALCLWWRERNWRRALPVFVVALAAVPLYAGELRLALRFGLSSSSGKTIGGGGAAQTQLELALRGFAGGNGNFFWILLALGLIGGVAVARSAPGFAIAGASSIVGAPALSLVAHVKSTETAFLSPRHLLVALPFWAVLIGVGAVRVARLPVVRADLAVGASIVVVATLAALGRHTASADPRTLLPFTRSTGAIGTTNTVGNWLAARVEPGDVLYPYSVPILQSLPVGRTTRVLPRGDARTLIETLGNIKHVPTLWVVYPVGPKDRTRPAELHELRQDYAVSIFRTWLAVRVPGPFTSRSALLAALGQAVDDTASAVAPRGTYSWSYETLTEDTADKAASRTALASG
jgi:hypothetical protein